LQVRAHTCLLWHEMTSATHVRDHLLTETNRVVAISGFTGIVETKTVLGTRLLVVARDDVRNHGVEVGALAGGGLRVDSQHVPAAGRPQEAAVHPVTPFLRVRTPHTSAGDMVAAAPRDGKPPRHDVPAAGGPQKAAVHPVLPFLRDGGSRGRSGLGGI